MNFSQFTKSLRIASHDSTTFPLYIKQGEQATIFFKSANEMRKFSGLFRNCKSADFLDLPVDKKQIRNVVLLIHKSLQNTANSVTK